MLSHMRVCTSDTGLHAQAMVARNEVASILVGGTRAHKNRRLE